jgi:two-component system, chemotaxis family, protein-glutamate methylesterase/glutaminase
VNPQIALRRNIDAVVMGTSAGGVQALSMLLPALPADCIASVFVVIHLPRGRPSHLVDVFAGKCSLPVREAQDKEAVAPGTVYFAPADYHLLLDRGPQTALTVDDLVHHSRPSIDVLFESAAEVYLERLLGILLTGANEDGAAGLATVHDAGGVTVAQEPATAHSPRMILSALDRQAPDFVLTLERIAELLATLRPHPTLEQTR